MNDWNWMVLWVLLTIILMLVALAVMFVGWLMLMAAALEGIFYGDLYGNQAVIGFLVCLFGHVMFDYVSEGIPK